jgi:hypothetical protein
VPSSTTSHSLSTPATPSPSASATTDSQHVSNGRGGDDDTTDGDVESNPGPRQPATVGADSAARPLVGAATAPAQILDEEEWRRRFEGQRGACAAFDVSGQRRKRDPHEQAAHDVALRELERHLHVDKTSDRMLTVELADETTVERRHLRLIVRLLELQQDDAFFVVRPREGKRVTINVWAADVQEVDVNAGAAAPVFFRAVRFPMRYEREFFTLISVAPTDEHTVAAVQRNRATWHVEPFDPVARGAWLDAQERRLVSKPEPAHMARFVGMIASSLHAYADGPRAATEDGAAVRESPAERDTRRERALHEFLCAPNNALVALKGSANTATRTRFRATAMIREDAHNTVVLQDTVVRSAAQEVQRPHVGLTAAQIAEALQLEGDERARRTAKHHARDGHLSRAATALTRDAQQARRDINDLVRDLEALHPRGERLEMAKPPPGFEQPIAVSVIIDTLRQSSKASSPGATGWTEELLLLVMEADEGVAQRVAILVTHLANADVAESVRRRLTNGVLIGIPKESGTGTRPITLGECLLKVASRAAVAATRAQLQRAFLDDDENVLQFGVACPAGIDRVVHATRAFIQRAAPTGGVVGLLDFRNAFNTMSRPAIARVVAPFKHLAPLFWLEYSQPSLLRVRGTAHTIESSSGVRQGSVLGSALFSLTLQPVLLAAKRRFRVDIRAYIDDVSICAPNVVVLAEVVAFIAEESAKIGLALNTTKCELLGLEEHTRAQDGLVGRFRRATAVRLLGAAVGINDDVEARLARELYAADNSAAFFRRLGQEAQPWTMAVLRSCGVPKLNFAMRVNAPATLGDVVRGFDTVVDRVLFGEWACVDVPSAVSQLLAHFKTSDGGLGIRRSAWIHDAAFQASCEAAAMGKATPGRQRALVQNIDSGLIDELKRINVLAETHRQHQSQQYAQSLFTHLVVEVGAYAFSAELRRCLLSFPAGTPEIVRCACDTEFRDAANFYAHAPGCPSAVGFTAASRHAFVKNAVRLVAQQQDLVVDTREPRFGQCPGCQEWLDALDVRAHCRSCQRFVPGMEVPTAFVGTDLRITAGARNADIDVTVRSRCVASHVGTSIARIFKEAEDEKARRYKAIVERNGDTDLVVMAFTESGVPSPTTIATLRRFANLAARNRARAHGLSADNSVVSVSQQLAFLAAKVRACTALLVHGVEKHAGVLARKRSTRAAADPQLQRTTFVINVPQVIVDAHR